MNHDLWTHQLTAPLAIAVGVLACFWGYRIVKVIFGIMGFAGGFVGGWMAAASLAPGHDVIALVSALLGGAIGSVLCVWLYYWVSFCWVPVRAWWWLGPHLLEWATRLNRSFYWFLP